MKQLRLPTTTTIRADGAIVLEGRYAIYPKDGWVIYDEISAKDIPQWIFAIRDLLKGQE